MAEKDAKPKHLHTVRQRLADGTVGTYRYLHRGGPRIFSEVNSPAFFATGTIAAISTREARPIIGVEASVRSAKADGVDALRELCSACAMCARGQGLTAD